MTTFLTTFNKLLDTNILFLVLYSAFWAALIFGTIQLIRLVKETVKEHKKNRQ